MLQLILTAFQVFCGFGGPYVMPFIAPFMFLIMPPALIFGWLVLLLCFFTPIMTVNGGVNAVSSNDGKTRDSTRSFGFAFLFYYICMVIVACSVSQVACKVQEALPI